VDLVRSHLFPLAATPDHDATVGEARNDGAANLRANLGVVDRRFAVGASIVHVVSKESQHADEMLLQREARMIGSDGDAHVVKL
jgi:hypothetical protein